MSIRLRLTRKPTESKREAVTHHKKERRLKCAFNMQETSAGATCGGCRTNLGFQTPRPEIQSLDQTHTGNNDDIMTEADHSDIQASQANHLAFIKADAINESA